MKKSRRKKGSKIRRVKKTWDSPNSWDNLVKLVDDIEKGGKINLHRERYIEADNEWLNHITLK